MVLHLLNFGSTKKMDLHVLWFQSSAAHSQVYAAQFVQLLTLPLQLLTLPFQIAVPAAVFRGFLKINNL